MLATLLMLGTVLGSIETSRPNIKMRRANDVGDIFEIELSYDKAIETINIVDNINVQVKEELINGSKLNLLLH